MPITWRKFFILPNTSQAVKDATLRDAIVALQSNENVAILGLELIHQDVERKGVFLQRVGDDKRVSVSSKKINDTKVHASTRHWSKIRHEDDEVWVDFKKIVEKDIQNTAHTRKDWSSLLSYRKH